MTNDADRLRDQVNQVLAGKAELAHAKTQGVTCKKCGATMALPGDLSLEQFPCPYCGALHLLSDYVSPQVLHGQRMRAHVDGIMAEAHAQQKRQDRIALIAAGAATLFVVGVLALTFLLGR